MSHLLIVFSLVTSIAWAGPVESPETLAQEKRQQAALVPDWVKELRAKQIRDYFTPAEEHGEIDQAALRRLLADAIKLHDYFEGQDASGEYLNFVTEKLTPFVLALNPEALEGKIQARGFTRPIGEWTVETLVISQQVAFLTRYPDFVKRALDILSLNHFRGISFYGISLVVGLVTTYLAFKSSFIAGFLVGTLTTVGGTFKTGPLTALMNAATGWFVRPTTEFIQVMESRYTGKIEAALNRRFDRFKPKNDGDAAEKRNERPRVANVADDGTDFAGMSPADQEKNWDKNLTVWVGVAKRFSRLLRGTHTIGRMQTIQPWLDEEMAAQMVETMDSKLLLLDLESKAILAPYQTSLLVAGKTDDADAILLNFSRFEALHAKLVLSVDLTEVELTEVGLELAAINEGLRAWLPESQLEALEAIQEEKARAVGVLVAGLAVHEIRLFSSAESNRNLEPDARVAQRAVRRNFRLQTQVERYLPLVQRQQREMGYQNSQGEPLKDRENPCAIGLEGRPHRLEP